MRSNGPRKSIGVLGRSTKRSTNGPQKVTAFKTYLWAILQFNLLSAGKRAQGASAALVAGCVSAGCRAGPFTHGSSTLPHSRALHNRIGTKRVMCVYVYMCVYTHMQVCVVDDDIKAMSPRHVFWGPVCAKNKFHFLVCAAVSSDPSPSKSMLKVALAGSIARAKKVPPLHKRLGAARGPTLTKRGKG